MLSAFKGETVEIRTGGDRDMGRKMEPGDGVRQPNGPFGGPEVSVH